MVFARRCLAWSIGVPDQRRAVFPAADHLGGNPFFAFVFFADGLGYCWMAGAVSRGVRDKDIKGRHILFQLPDDQERAVLAEVAYVVCLITRTGLGQQALRIGRG